MTVKPKSKNDLSRDQINIKNRDETVFERRKRHFFDQKERQHDFRISRLDPIKVSLSLYTSTDLDRFESLYLEKSRRSNVDFFDRSLGFRNRSRLISSFFELVLTVSTVSISKIFIFVVGKWVVF